MSILHQEWTADLLNQLPDDGNRYEVIDGQLYVTPAPSSVHQDAVAQLFLRLWPYSKELRLDLKFAPFAIKFTDRREVQPDLLVMPRKSDGRFASTFSEVGKLLLAVEVLSPYSQRTDRSTKLELYQSEGVDEYWIVDCESREIRRWLPNDDKSEILTAAMSWKPLASHDEFTFDVAQYFRDVHREDE